MVSTNSTCSPPGQQKNLPSFHHLWPGFMSLPHYSKKTPQVQALQSAHLLLPALFFPGKASPMARCSQRRNPLLPFKELPLTKKHVVTNYGLITAYNVHAKNNFKRHLELRSHLSQTEWQYVHEEFFACPFCFQGNKMKFPTSQTE